MTNSKGHQSKNINLIWSKAKEERKKKLWRLMLWNRLSKNKKIMLKCQWHLHRIKACFECDSERAYVWINNKTFSYQKVVKINPGKYAFRRKTVSIWNRCFWKCLSAEKKKKVKVVVGIFVLSRFRRSHLNYFNETNSRNWYYLNATNIWYTFNQQPTHFGWLYGLEISHPHAFVGPFSQTTESENSFFL